MICSVCATPQEMIFTKRLLNKYDVEYWFCPSCKFLCTQKPYWLEESYADVIARTDTGTMRRNLTVSSKLCALLRRMFSGSGKYLDIGGGHGVLTRLMRDYGFDYYWQDDHAANLFARGFEGDIDSGGPYKAVSAIEVVDHVEDPAGLVRHVIEATGCEAFVFTTELYHGERPPQSWWNYAENSGQHIAQFHNNTLSRLADSLKLHLSSNGSLHMLSRQPFNARVYKLLTGGLSTRLTPLVAGALLSSRLQSDSTLLVQAAQR